MIFKQNLPKVEFSHLKKITPCLTSAHSSTLRVARWTTINKRAFSSAAPKHPPKFAPTSLPPRASPEHPSLASGTVELPGGWLGTEFFGEILCKKQTLKKTPPTLFSSF